MTVAGMASPRRALVRAARHDRGRRFVKLDICEELLRREEWETAEAAARELAELFTGAGVPVASAQTIDYLRRAAERREATAETVRYVRTYVQAGETAPPFAPPARNRNPHAPSISATIVHASTPKTFARCNTHVSEGVFSPRSRKPR